jgi:hypothetical protein
MVNEASQAVKLHIKHGCFERFRGERDASWLVQEIPDPTCGNKTAGKAGTAVRGS